MVPAVLEGTSATDKEVHTCAPRSIYFATHLDSVVSVINKIMIRRQVSFNKTFYQDSIAIEQQYKLMQVCKKNVKITEKTYFSLFPKIMAPGNTSMQGVLFYLQGVCWHLNPEDESSSTRSNYLEGTPK